MRKRRYFTMDREAEIVKYAHATGHGHKRVTKELGLACSPMTVYRILQRDRAKRTVRGPYLRCLRCGEHMQHTAPRGNCGFCIEEIEHKIPANGG